MRVLVPDLPAFRDLTVPAAELLPCSPRLPIVPADGAVLWSSSSDFQQKLLHSGIRWALTLSSGTDHLQVPSGVTLYNAPDLHARTVATHVLAGMLHAVRGYHLFRDAAKNGQWLTPPPPLGTLEGARVLIWGHGHIGRELERLLQPFGATVYGITSKTEPDLLEYRLEQADWVVVLLPLNLQTDQLIDAKVFSKMKRGAWLVCAGRGKTLCMPDLLHALDHGLAGALLDVTDPEPLPAEHPLWMHPRVILTPHVASQTADLVERAARYTRNFLLELSQGQLD